MRFTPTEDFLALNSHYVKGLGYTARTPELKHLVELWLREGKVSLGDAPAAEVEGH